MRSAAGAGSSPGARTAAAAALAAATALARPAAPGTGPGAAAATGVGASALGSGAVLDESDLSTVDFGAIQLLQGPLHVRVEPELDHTLVLPALVGVGIGHLPCLPHVVLQVLPTAAAGEILNNKSIVCPYRRSVTFSSAPATPISTFLKGNKERVGENEDWDRSWK